MAALDGGAAALISPEPLIDIRGRTGADRYILTAADGAKGRAAAAIKRRRRQDAERASVAAAVAASIPPSIALGLAVGASCPRQCGGLLYEDSYERDAARCLICGFVAYAAPKAPTPLPDLGPSDSELRQARRAKVQSLYVPSGYGEIINLAKQLKVSENIVRRDLDAIGMNTRLKDRMSERRARAVAFKAQGLSRAAIADRMNLSERQVKRALKGGNWMSERRARANAFKAQGLSRAAIADRMNLSIQQIARALNKQEPVGDGD